MRLRYCNSWHEIDVATGRQSSPKTVQPKNQAGPGVPVKSSAPVFFSSKLKSKCSAFEGWRVAFAAAAEAPTHTTRRHEDARCCSAGHLPPRSCESDTSEDTYHAYRFTAIFAVYRPCTTQPPLGPLGPRTAWTSLVMSRQSRQPTQARHR